MSKTIEGTARDLTGDAPKTTHYGRPLEYEPGFCQIVIDYMALGYSRYAVAGVLRVSRETLHDWSRKYQEFSDALQIGESMRVFYLEGGLLDGNSTKEMIIARMFALKHAERSWAEATRLNGPGSNSEAAKLEDTRPAKERLAGKLVALRGAANDDSEAA